MTGIELVWCQRQARCVDLRQRCISYLCPQSVPKILAQVLSVPKHLELLLSLLTPLVLGLGLSYIDRFLIHSPIGGKILDTWDAMVELQEQKLVKSIGVSNFSQKHLEELKKARPNHIPTVNQVEITPFLQTSTLVEYCHREGIILEAYSPLAQGGKLQDKGLLDVANKYGKSSAQVMIRWSLQSGFICIPKSVKESRIKENGDVFDFTLSTEDMATLNGMNENFRVCWNPLEQKWEP